MPVLKPALRLSGLAQALITVLAAGAAVGTLTGFFGKYWLLELTSHFRMQYAAILLAPAILQAVRRKFIQSGLWAVLSGLNVILVCAHGSPGPARQPVGTPMRALLSNVRTGNREYGSVLRLVRERDPDFVVLEEVNALWLEQLREMRARYPHALLCPREDNFGVALFSKHPFEKSEVLYLGDAEVPSLKAEIVLEGRRVLLLATHPLPPGSPEYFHLRNGQLAAVAAYVRAENKPTILLGDLNATPWSPHFRRLTRKTGLHLPAFSLRPTWPTSCLLMGIPIDHCLLSRDFAGLTRTVGPAIGSDHLPVQWAFGFAENP